MQDSTKQTILMLSEKDFETYLTKLYEKITKDASTDPVWIPESQVMEMTGLRSKTSIWKLRKTYAIRWAKFGSTVLYHRESILEMIAQHEQKPLI